MLKSVKSLVRKAPALKKSQTLAEATRVMVENGFFGLAVVDERDKPIGVLTDGDLLNCFYINVTNYSYESKAEHTKAHFEERVKRFGSLPVADIMTLKPKTINENDTVEKAVELLKRNRIKRLVAVDDADNYTGLLERLDVANSVLA
ncbi:MAG: CBS domain-containing protein [Candidatus Micrarchaeota archaeon]